MEFRKKVPSNEVVLEKYSVNMWECTDQTSIFFGKHDSGFVNIPVGHFEDEEMTAWIADGKLTLVK